VTPADAAPKPAKPLKEAAGKTKATKAEAAPAEKPAKKPAAKKAAKA